ncbi:MAG: hypothetical protein WDZ41_05815 [Candidatus Babeliales bacterium]
MNDKRTNVLISWYLLYFTYGFIPIIAGLDKYFYFLADWSMYLNHAIPEFLGIQPHNFMLGVGIIEIFAGLLVFFKPKIGGLVVCIWLILISINLVSMGTHTHNGHAMVHYDVAVRDIAMAIGAYVLMLLSKELKK